MIPTGCYKHGHSTREQAMRHVANLKASGRYRERGDRPLKVYQCPACRMWHVGHASPEVPKWKKQA